MATSKTLTPTNVTISIPEFTDQPDQRVNSDCIDKLGDAVNTLQSNKVNTSAIKNNVTTTSSGYVLDARQGKKLNDAISPSEWASSNYSTVLAMVNDLVTTKGRSLPFSFVKVGNGSISDVPSAISTNEFTGIVYGSGARLTVMISQYGNTSYSKRRDIFNGNWNGEWA